jgi:hypothetical protein
MAVHALGTHVLQVLPIAGWWLGRGGVPEGRWRPRVLWAAALYAAAMMLAAAHALAVA